MAGIVFYASRDIDSVVAFYREKLNCELWLKQEDCTVLRHDNLLFGFCSRNEIDSAGIITFFYDSPDEVDRVYSILEEFAEKPPLHNRKYDIYHFFAQDPEGRTVEIQYFAHPLNPHISGEKLLLSRRSQRDFKSTDIPDELIGRIIDNCRFAPSSHNRQPCYFKVIRNRDICYRLSDLRGSSSGPIAKAPVAVAIISDPDKSQRHIQDACIMAYHFLLAARSFGLGTCWIADMDRNEVKEILGISREHYIATITPLGYPENINKAAPSRKPLEWYLREK